LGVEAFQTRNVIPPFEIDVYVESKKLGIEFNGLYWHSERAGVDPHKHQLKTELCAEKGIRLLHIFEDEWRDKQAIVKSMVLHRLGLSKRLHARSCVVLDCCDRQSIDKFLDDNHLEGTTAYERAFALSHQGAIVACLALRHSSDIQRAIEVVRFCCVKETHVVGALSRLLKYARLWAACEGYRYVLAYVDQRFGNGSAYAELGFGKILDTTVKIWQTDFHNRLDNDEAVELARIWGCKSSCFILEL
jgi:hypothetical protein